MYNYIYDFLNALLPVEEVVLQFYSTGLTLFVMVLPFVFIYKLFNR